MITKRRLAMLAFCVIFGAALAMAGFILSGAAKADSSTARVEVYWTGANCIDIQHATGEVVTRCGGYASFVNPSTGPGWTTGVDPIMGAASQISCSFYLNGSLEYVDMAFAGDGTDVNCIREIIYVGPQNGMYV